MYRYEILVDEKERVYIWNIRESERRVQNLTIFLFCKERNENEEKKSIKGRGK
jgi:hypothetical protein